MPKVLISDKLSAESVKVFEKYGIDVEINTNLSEKDLNNKIGSFDGLAIRSSTRVTKKTLEYANNLKIIGRAGIGVDNIDLDMATQKGIIVMNTPFGNSITTAEHTIALMMALSKRSSSLVNNLSSTLPTALMGSAAVDENKRVNQLMIRSPIQSVVNPETFHQQYGHRYSSHHPNVSGE